MSLWRPHSGASVSLTVQLPLHEEVTLLFEVHVAVGAHEAAGVAEFVSRFHHRPAVGEKTQMENNQIKGTVDRVYSGTYWQKLHIIGNVFSRISVRNDVNNNHLVLFCQQFFEWLILTRIEYNLSSHCHRNKTKYT